MPFDQAIQIAERGTAIDGIASRQFQVRCSTVHPIVTDGHIELCPSSHSGVEVARVILRAAIVHDAKALRTKYATIILVSTRAVFAWIGGEQMMHVGSIRRRGRIHAAALRPTVLAIPSHAVVPTGDRAPVGLAIDTRLL